MPRKVRARPADAMALPDDRLWTPEEAAYFFQRSEKWVRRWVPCVRMPGENGGKGAMYEPAVCREWVAAFRTSNRPALREVA
jgi:hypothetical protein